MVRKGRQPTLEQKVDLFDVRLLDMFAELEALGRYGRVAQHQVIPLRACAAPITNARRRALTQRLVKAVRQIRQESRELVHVIEQLASAADELERT